MCQQLHTAEGTHFMPKGVSTRSVGRTVSNDEIHKKVLDDKTFQEALMDLYAAKLYRRLRSTS